MLNTLSIWSEFTEMKRSTHSNNPHNASKIQLHNSTSITLELETMANANTTLQTEAYGSLWKLWCMLLLSPIVCKNFKSFLVQAGICLQKNRNKKFSSSIFYSYLRTTRFTIWSNSTETSYCQPHSGFFFALFRKHMTYFTSRVKWLKNKDQITIRAKTTFEKC